MINLLNKTIKIPKDLDEVITYNPDEEVDPRRADMEKKDADKIWDSIVNLYKTRVHPAITFCLRKNGKIIFNRAIGHAKGNGPKGNPFDKKNEQKVLATPDTPICLFSASKAVTAMLIHLLNEKNKINLMDPVCHYIPEFGKLGKEDITIYHILTHRAGIPYLPSDTPPEILFDHKKSLEFLCDMKPIYPVGRKNAYHAVTGGFIFDEIVRRVTGKTIRAFIKKEICDPLNFKYFNYGLPTKEIDNAAINYSTGYPIVFPFSSIVKRALSAPWNTVLDISNDPRFTKAIIPSANIFATAEEVSKFYQLLLNKGNIDGKQIFDPLTIKRATTPTGNFEIDKVLLLPVRYSAGMILGNFPVGLYGACATKAFGHLGFLNIITWADPERDIAVALMTTGKLLLGSHLISLGKVLGNISLCCS